MAARSRFVTNNLGQQRGRSAQLFSTFFTKGPSSPTRDGALPRLACRSRAPFSAPTFPRNDREPHEKRAPSKPEERRDHADRNGLPDDNESVCRWIDVDRGSSPSKMPDHVARHFCVPVKYPSYMEFQLFESISSSSSSSSFFLFLSSSKEISKVCMYRVCNVETYVNKYS